MVQVKLGTYSSRGPPPPAAVVASKLVMSDPRAEPRYGERVPYVVGAPFGSCFRNSAGPYLCRVVCRRSCMASLVCVSWIWLCPPWSIWQSADTAASMPYTTSRNTSFRPYLVCSTLLVGASRKHCGRVRVCNRTRLYTQAPTLPHGLRT